MKSMLVSSPYVHTVCVCLIHSSKSLPFSTNSYL